MSWIRTEGKLAPHIHMLDDNLFGAPQTLACYVVEGAKKRALIDAGGKLEARKLAGKLKERNLAPDIIIPTHSHWDHAAGLGTLLAEKNFPKAEVVASRHGLGALRAMTEFNKGFGEYALNLPSVEKVTPVKDGDVIDLGGVELTVHETPGHTRCSISLLESKTRALFLGDSLGYKNIPGFYIAPIMPPEFSEAALLTTIAKVEKLDYVTLCPAHYGQFTGDMARRIPDEVRERYQFWKKYIITCWKEEPAISHAAQGIQKMLAVTQMPEMQAKMIGDMFGDWLVKGMQSAKFI